jgi:NAD(P)-dependent dehydrogenase (short-subunit alcohol dehydrogenase family)
MGRRRRSRGRKLLAGGALAWLGWQLSLQMRERSLAGQVVLITGGSRGLGLLMAREFAGEGCRLVICARDEQQLDAAADDLAARGAEVLALRCDVADAEDVQRMVARATEHYGRVDIVVNNAGIIQSAPVGAMTLEDFEQAMAINFFGAVHTTLSVLPQMRARGDGRIVNITSIGGKVAVPHLLPYDAAKFATVGLSEGLRSELAKDGITVTTIVPGLMRTGSPVNAYFKGDPEAEFAWFSLGAATPVSAMSAERAARRIVLATQRGEAEVTLSWQAKLLRLTHDLFPGATADLLGLVNRILPADESVQENVRGMQLDTTLSPSPLTTLMNRAAIETNQYGGRPVPAAAHAESVGLRREGRGKRKEERGKRSRNG